MSGDELGSEELSQEDFDTYESKHQDVLTELYRVVKERDGAKEFLGTAFGIALRKTLVVEKLKAMKACSETIGAPGEHKCKHKYDVICEVERIFGLIIVDGDNALRQLQQLSMEKGD